MPTNAGGVSVKIRLDDKDAVNELAKLQRKIRELTEKLNEQKTDRDAIGEQMEAAANKAEDARYKVQQLQQQLENAPNPEAYERIKNALSVAQAEFKEQSAIAEKLGPKYEAAAAKVEKTERALDRATKSAADLQKQIAAMNTPLAKVQTGAQKAVKKMGQLFSWLGNRVGKVFLFRTVYRALDGLRKRLEAMYKASPEVRKELEDLRGAALTALQPLYESSLPLIVWLLQQAVTEMNKLATVSASMFGTTVEQARQSAEALWNETEGIEATSKAAKEAQKQLAGFDTLNVLSGNKDSGGSSNDKVGATFNAEETHLNAADLITAELELVIGAILTFTGTSPLIGLGMMAAGAAKMYQAFTMDWGYIKKELQGHTGDVVEIIGDLSTIVGGVLLLAGGPSMLPLGIGLLVGGLLAMGTVEVARFDWNSLKQQMEGPVGDIVGFVSSALLMLGVVLLFTPSNLPLGIGLIAAGAVGLAPAVAAKWDSLKERLEGPLGTIIAIVSGLSLVLGIILLFAAPTAWPLALGLIVAGAAGMAATIPARWDAIITAMRGPLGLITGLVGASLLVLGVILLFAGQIPLGLGLIVAGGAAAGLAIGANWNFLKDKIKGVWESIKTWFQANVAPIFTKEWWQDKFSAIGEGLKSRLKDALNAGVDLLNRFVGWLNDTFSFEWDAVTIAGAQIIPAGQMQLFHLPEIPRLAQGAVIPPNREFMAVLGDQSSGTNIEAPLSTIQEAVRTASGSDEIIAAMVRIGNQLMQEIRDKDTATYLDGRETARWLYKPMKEMQRTMGGTMVTVG